jgi:hypothetical protein
MVAVAVLIILTALASAVLNGMGTARMNNSVFDVAALVNAAQLRAISRGVPNYIFIHQDPVDRLVRVRMIERPDADPVINWAALDLTQGPGKALEFSLTQPDGTVVVSNGIPRDQLVLGTSTGPDSGGLAFLDLDSISNPLPPPFSAISLNTPLFTPADPTIPTGELMAGCNFCINPAGEPYGALRFNADGTMEVMTGNAISGAVIAFAPDTRSEVDVPPKLLTISAPAGATVVF